MKPKLILPHKKSDNMKKCLLTEIYLLPPHLSLQMDWCKKKLHTCSPLKSIFSDCQVWCDYIHWTRLIAVMYEVLGDTQVESENLNMVFFFSDPAALFILLNMYLQHISKSSKS